MHPSYVHAFVCCALVLGTPAIVSAQSSTSHWKFEEASGATALDSNGGFHGTLVNGVSRMSAGRVGRALSFDGINDYVSVPDTPSLESAAFSAAVWVRRNGPQQPWARIMSKGNGAAAPFGSYKFEFDGASDSIVTWHLGFTDLSYVIVRAVTPLADGQWAHLVGTYDGATAKLYVNGVLDASLPIEGKSVRFDGMPLTMGAYNGWSYFRGDLDEVQYFNYPLSAGQVQAVFATSSPSLTVTNPNAATAWAVGSIQPITWSHSLPGTSTSIVEISRDGGTTWAVIAASAANTTPTGTYSWTVTGPSTAQARIRVRATNGSASDTSDVSFNIAAATIAVTSPNLSSVVWTAGQTATVTWTSNLTSQENVKIELSTNGGSTFPIVIATSTPSDGTHSIGVAGAWVTTSALVRVSWVKDASRFDVSDTPFRIQSSTLTTITFQSTSEIFHNPERGFTSWTDLSYADFLYVRVRGDTLSRPYFRLDSYRNTALPQSFLNLLTSGFQKARQAGIKLIPRFSYNFGPYPNSAPDASRERIEQHLQQLAPILAANTDVILSMEAGFIGAWGEWHTSTNGLDTNPTAKAAILSAVLAAVPTSRMVALRYPSDMQLLNGPPITAAEAFTGTPRARIGSHQDCFLASADDYGTWGRSGNTYAYDKAYVAENGKYAVVGGETCYPNPPRSSCPTALSELASMHWTYLNGEFEPNVLQGWFAGGCYDEIDRRLGYRFKLLSGTYSQSNQRGQPFQFSLQVFNEGFASMVNERPVLAVIYKGSESYTCELNTDPRWWAPNATTTITGSCALPSTMTTGTYSWALWLPDQSPSIQNNPLYAVRLANQGLWDATRGYNVLVSNLTVTP